VDDWAVIEGEPTVASVGEGAALAAVFPRLAASRERIIGPGDDAAVLAAPDGRVVITVDTMIEGPDFRRAFSSPSDVGWKLAATNLSDVAAMGARPSALVVALAVPPDTPVRVLEGIADGLRNACATLAPGCGIEGGDLARADVVTAAVTAFGDLEGREPVLRGGARPGDVVALSGRLGEAARGLALLFEHGMRAAAARAADAVDAQLRPRPPIADGVAAARAGATAMLDVSDGLVLDARRIARASSVAIDLEASAIQSILADTAGYALGDLERALEGGEDHGLLATFPPDVALPGAFRPIGRVTAGEGVLVDGAPYGGRGGWDPFRV